MRIVVMGAGGVGGYFGAKLAHAGHDVGFVARGVQLHALRDDGLRVESPLGNIHIPRVQVSDDPAAFGRADFVLICVKLWDTQAASQALRSVVDSDTTVISLQNGVQKDEVIGKVLGKEVVAGGVCYLASKILRPGVISHTGTMQRLVFGSYDGSTSTKTSAFLKACLDSGIESEISSDIRRAIWEKFVFLVGFSACTAVMRKPIGEIRANPVTRAFLLDLMQEAVVVGHAQGIGLHEQYANERLAFCDGLPPVMTSSMHNDLEQGRRLEVEWLSGSVVELGRVVGVSTPLNSVVNAALALYAKGIPIVRDGC